MSSRNRNPADWMLSDAMAAMAKPSGCTARCFRPPRCDGVEPCWEPPVDVLETEHDVLVLVALPGVDPDRVEALIEDGQLVVRGRRLLPPELRRAVIHRLELPQGRFERRIPLPAGRYSVRHIPGTAAWSSRSKSWTKRGRHEAPAGRQVEGGPPKAESEGWGAAVPLPEDALILLPVRDTVLFPGIVIPSRSAGRSRSPRSSRPCARSVRSAS